MKLTKETLIKIIKEEINEMASISARKCSPRNLETTQETIPQA